MKIFYIFLILAPITASNCLNAQIKKGAYLLGGDIGFYKQTSQQSGNTTNTGTSFTFSPVFGKAIKENVVLGMDLTYNYFKNDVPGNYNAANNSFGAGIFLRKYKPLGKGFYLFGQARTAAEYGTSKSINFSQQYPNSNSKGFSITAGIYPGISYAVSDKLQIETGFNNLIYLQYSYNKASATGSNDIVRQNFSLGSSLSGTAGLTIGFRILLN